VPITSWRSSRMKEHEMNISSDVYNEEIEIMARSLALIRSVELPAKVKVITPTKEYNVIIE
jgi:metal-sulfur cluster biosynthetic enzyme